MAKSLDSGSSSSSDKSSSKSSNSPGSGGSSLSSSSGSSSKTSSSKTSNSSSDKSSSGSKSSNYVNQSIANAEKNGGSSSSGGGSSSSTKNTAASMSSAGSPGSRSTSSLGKVDASLSYEGGSNKNAPLSSSEKAALREALTNTTSFSRPGPGATLEQLNALVGDWRFGPGEQVWSPPANGLPEIGLNGAVQPPAESWNPMQFLEDAMANGEKERARREAEGYKGDGSPLDINALLWDLNAPYREREVAAGGRPFEGPVDWGGLEAAFGGQSAAERDAALREERLRAQSDSPLDTPLSWDDLQNFAMSGARLDTTPTPNSGIASADQILAAIGDKGLQITDAFKPFGAAMDTANAVLSYGDNGRVPLPRPRPASAPDVQITVPTGDLEGISDEARYAANHPVTSQEEPTMWDNIVDKGGQVLANTTLGKVASSLFPDLWYGAGEAMKGISAGTGSGSANAPYWVGESLVGSNEDSGGYGGSGIPAPPPVAPPFPDVNHNGIDDRLEGGTVNEYDRFGEVVFPDMPPYNPGRDDEWLYFRKRAGLADGGIVGYADGGMVEPSPLAAAPGNDLNMADPRVQIIAAAEDALENALAGQPEPDDEADVVAFVEMFGEGALERLKENVQSGMKMRKGRMVRGPGGPKDDMVPAMVDGEQPVNLSNGEYVMPAEAVAAAGDGDPMAGAEALTELSDRLANRSKAA